MRQYIHSCPLITSDSLLEGEEWEVLNNMLAKDQRYTRMSFIEKERKDMVKARVDFLIAERDRAAEAPVDLGMKEAGLDEIEKMHKKARKA